jgi:hypothetical protein
MRYERRRAEQTARLDRLHLEHNSINYKACLAKKTSHSKQLPFSASKYSG